MIFNGKFMWNRIFQYFECITQLHRSHLAEFLELTYSAGNPAPLPSALCHTDQLFSSCPCSPSNQPRLGPVLQPLRADPWALLSLQPRGHRGGHVTEDQAIHSVQESAVCFWAPDSHVQLCRVVLVPLQPLCPHHGKQWQHCDLCFKWVS